MRISRAARRAAELGVLAVGATTLLSAGALPAEAASGPCPAFTAVAVGGLHTVALTASGTVWAWGDNAYGQVGDGTRSDRAFPIEIPGVSGVSAVSTGMHHTLAVGAGGTVWAWGENGSGALGDGTTTDRLVPIQVPNLSGIVQVAAGSSHSLALTSSGTVYAWGYGEDGELGDGTWTTRITPTAVPGLTGVVKIAAGDFHSLAVTANGTQYVWGWNGHGQLGDGTHNDKSTPWAQPTLTRVSSTAGGYVDSFSVDARSRIFAWGENFYGQLGDGTRDDRYTPVQVVNVQGATAVAAGDFHSAAIGTGGAVWTWGYNPQGQLGDGTTVDRAAPAQVPGLTGVTSVEAGNLQTAVVVNGAVKTWGANASGELGDGTTTNRSVPVSITCEAPTIMSANHTPATVTPGSNVTFSVGWNDPNVGQSARAVICKTPAIGAGATCPGGTWARGGLVAASPATATYTATEADVGTRAYYAFACDAANVCSTVRSGSFTVVNAVCSDGIDNDEDGLVDHPADPGCSSELDDSEDNRLDPVYDCAHNRNNGLWVIEGHALVEDRELPTVVSVTLTCTLVDTNGVTTASATQTLTSPAVALAQAMPGPFVALSKRCAYLEVRYLDAPPNSYVKCVDFVV